MPVLNELEYSGTETEEWDQPALEDFDHGSNWDDLDRDTQMDVVAHFLVTEDTDENPPETFQQLTLPVVNPETNDLNKRAVDNASARLPQTKGLSDDFKDRVNDRIEELQSEEFGE